MEIFRVLIFLLSISILPIFAYFVIAEVKQRNIIFLILKKTKKPSWQIYHASYSSSLNPNDAKILCDEKDVDAIELHFNKVKESRKKAVIFFIIFGVLMAINIFLIKVLGALHLYS